MHLMLWRNKNELPENGGFKIKFTLKKGELYSFWLTDDIGGKSEGYLATGSEDYGSDIDN